jgi:hypothetical protein
MTTDQIDEAQNLVADMRNVVADLNGVTDAEQLTTLVLEKVPPMFERFDQLRTPRRLEIFGPVDVSLWFRDVAELLAFAQIVQRRPEYMEKLVPLAATNLPHAVEVLDRVALKLAAQSPESTAPRND